MPPLALARCTASSVLMRMSAPSMAPTPVTSSITPTLIGEPVGAAAGDAEVAAGAVVAAGGVGAGVEHAASTQARPPSQTAARAGFFRTLECISRTPQCFICASTPPQTDQAVGCE